MAKKRRPRKKKKIGKKRQWPLGLIAIALFCLVTLGAAFYILFLWQGAGVREAAPPPSDVSRPSPAPPARILEAEKIKQHPPEPVEDQGANLPFSEEFEGKLPVHLAKVAIVIDDMGYHRELGERLMDLDLKLSFAFLPHAPHTRVLAQKARARGHDILLHLPMEPRDSRWDPGPGKLSVAMTREEISRRFNEDLADVPFVVGVNNHMGSRFTEDESGMGVVLELVRAKNLFFLDSLTSPTSVGFRMGRDMGVKVARRQRFLDNDHDVNQIRRQLDSLLAVADKRGEAIAIGHPHETTLAALQAYQKEFEARVLVVGVHELMH